MESTHNAKAFIFDLDNTLFDHYHSLRSAISAIQSEYTNLEGYAPNDLISKYNAALQKAYDLYLEKRLTYEEADLEKVRLFFTDLGLEEPTVEDISHFRAIYKPAYRENRRATPGSIETLCRLREHGYPVAILTNGQIKDQEAKAEFIGVRHLVDHIITSEEAGCSKPDPRLFQLAVDALNTNPDTTYMVGDSPDSDMKGALDGGLRPILYSPMETDTHCLLFGRQVPVIRHMSQLLEFVRIQKPRFELRFIDEESKLLIEGLGIDLVTEPRHCLRISKESVRSIASNMGEVLVAASQGQYVSAIYLIVEMIRIIAKAATLIDETSIQISSPQQPQKEALIGASPQYQAIESSHSIRIEYTCLTVETTPANEKTIREVATLLQSHCNDLMRDYPRSAIRNLRAIVLVLDKLGGTDTIVIGEGIDR